MTDLEQSLIAIGGAVIVGVVVYNKWQEYRTRRSVERAFSSTHDDVLMSPPQEAAGQEAHGGRQEPSFDDGEHVDTQAAADDALDHHIHMDDAGASVVAAADEEQQAVVISADSFKAEPPKDSPVDDMIDCVVPLTFANKVRGGKILQALQTASHAGNKPVHFVGLREDQAWEPVEHGNSYLALHAGVQLASRAGALNELEYSEFVNLLRRVGDELDGEPDLPDMKDVMKSARAVQQLVAQFDAQLSVNVQSNGAPWAISTLLTALERQGFDVRPDGKLVMPDGDGGILFTLATNVTLADDTSSRLTLLLDVPCVAPQRDGYGAMISFAKVLSSRLGGTVVDDTNQPLSDAALAEIARQVQAFCGDMETVGIRAGSTRALRLFG